MEYTEQKIYEALGLGAEAQETAEPAAQHDQVEPPTGAQEQEPAAPALEEETTPSASSDNSEEAEKQDADASDHQAEKQPQTPEQRKQNAARRRQREQQAAIDQAVKAALARERKTNDAAMAAFFAKAGLKNSVTGQPITNMDEFDQWQREFGQEQLSRQLKAGKLTAEGLATAIGNHPVVQQARELVDQNAAAQKSQQMEAVRAKIDAEIAEISKLDQSVSSLEDLMEKPYWKDIYAKTKRGYSITDAYYLINREALEKAKVDAAQQQAMNKARGKNHLTRTAAPTGTGAVSVPAAEMAVFRQFMPNATDAEIQAYYNQYKNK